MYLVGSEANHLFGIASGSARMHLAINEHEQRVAHVCGPGFWFGEYEFVAKVPRIMEIEAAEDLKLLCVNRVDFDRMAVSTPDAWKWLTVLSSQHLAIAIGAGDDLMLPDLEKRVVTVLLRFCGARLGHPASPLVRRIPVTQAELAVAANLSRSSAGKVLRELERAGEITIDYGAINVCDVFALTKRLG